ncbi:glycoside hydrolase family 20 protein [Flavobacterium terrisoli]|uniref:glycoside hydrolase family 20 protein n=1 Tax=Flavobacterium terrisoli TaxID=3242195 RepID=UPI0025434706|nr:family 20 glycosylhydrolase [Flavobacterium buctense]
MTSRLTVFLVLLFNIAFSQNPLPIIPKPASIDYSVSEFKLNKETIIETRDTTSFEVLYLKEAIKSQTGLDLRITSEYRKENKILVIVERDDLVYTRNDAYDLLINKNKISISAPEKQGAFFGIQSLLQLIPSQGQKEFQIQGAMIYDQPKYAWRGMHLDCARHFFAVDFVKKYIDYLAMYKMNTFHWHLTDDQGWRIEIKQYPKLTEIGAWRNGSMVGHYSDQKYDDKRYGGFYTQDQIKEVVAYAKQRHITVVPEIEMPGHAVAALAAYPQYSCTGGPFEVGKQWGVLDDVFCPKEETFTFLENILTEVMALFPSEYIHIGGDECPKTRWKNCPHCQALMKQNGLKDEHELQSYFIQTIEKFVNSKGRKIIGWDEILEGGLAPNAAVMSWRGTEGGIAAAKQKHYVVMTPGSHCYFDYYQGDPKNEPLAIGGYVPVEKVYSFNPTPKELSAEEAKYILGAQANVWTEYMEDEKKVEYMIFPRMMALSEVLWGTANPEKYADFQNRLIQQFSVLDKKGINYSKAIFEVTTKVSPSANGILFELNSANDAKKIKYTTDGTAPNSNSNSYVNPIEINKNQTIKAAYFENGKQQSATIEQAFLLNKATGKKIALVNQPHENYSNGGAFTLIDGVSANRSKLGKDWLGLSGKDLNATIDLGKSETINKVTVSVLESQGSWIYYPKGIEVLISNDDQNFQSIKQLTPAEIKAVKGEVVVNFKSQNARYIKIIAANLGKIPAGNPGEGAEAWLFVDEIGVE